MSDQLKFLKEVVHYKLIEELYKEGENIIYLGVDNRNDKLIAAKAILKSSLPTKDKLKNQLQILKVLKHENIIRLKDLQKSPNYFYIITEYCNGGKLSEFLKYYKEKNKAPLNEVYIQKIIRQISSGLEYIHSKNIIHRGINLENIDINFNKFQNIVIKGKVPPKIKYSEISLNDSFTLKIANMEFSKDLKSETSTKTVIGNIAPDMLCNNSYNSKIDLWALGSITYELLTGEKPFSGENSKDMLNKIKEGKYNLPSTLVASSEIISFINGLLQFYPEKRMDWPQIKTHPFLVDKVDNFHFIELKSIKNIDNNTIEMNSKDCDNLLWILYQGKNTTFKVDKMNINSNENEKKEMEKNINENKVTNEEIKKVAEEKKINIEEEKKRLNEERKEAQELKKEGELKMKEANEKSEERVQIKNKINQLKDQLKNKEDENIKKQIEELNEKINKIDELTKSADKLFANAQKKKNKAEKELVSIKIQELIPEEKLSTLKTEKEVLQFFNTKEKEINKYIFMAFGKSEFLKEFAINKIEEIFQKNTSISEITKNIYEKLESIPLDTIETEDQYNEQIFAIFEDVILPKFLTDKYVKDIQNKSFNKNRSTFVTNIITTLMKRNYTTQTKTIIEFFESIKDNKIKPFENIDNKKEIFDLFIMINIRVFKRTYFDVTFYDFLKNNDALIKEIFGNDTKYNEIIEKTEEKSINNKKEELFNLIKKGLNMNTDKIYIIIASFYYLLIYRFKDVKNIKGRTNNGNVFINNILKNFVLYLSQKFDNLSKNLIDLLNEICIFDFTSLMCSGEERKNKTYSFKDIKEIMSKCGSKLRNKFNDEVKEYENAIEEDIGMFTVLHNKVGEKNINIKLIAVDENVYSNTITIIVDMHSNNDKRNEWNNFINYFDKETMFYFYQWSEFSKKDLLQNGNGSNMRKKLAKQNIIKAKKLSKFCGIFLADILISNKFFNNYQINLVGFGLGANVVKHCLKHLSLLNGTKNYVKFKNVILIGAATHINKVDKWIEHIEKTVVDRFINCYSREDEILKNFYIICSSSSNKLHRDPIGIDSLEIRNDKVSHIIRNFDFSEKNYDLLSYENEKIAERIFGINKDI